MKIILAIFLLLLQSCFNAAATASDELGFPVCCQGDLNGDGVVAGDDLAALLGSWGGPGSADLDSSGVVDAADLATLLGAWGDCSASCFSTLLMGSVVLGDGSVVNGAAVITDQGGLALTNESGTYALEIKVPDGISSITVSAMKEIGGATYVGTALASPLNLGGVTSVPPLTLSQPGECDPEWIPMIGSNTGLTAAVTSIAVFDDGLGRGPELYVGGTFSVATGSPANHIARWDGTTWKTLSTGLDSSVQALLVHDDGNGPRLYAGGFFTTAGGIPANRIARWNGLAWEPLGAGVNGPVFALASIEPRSGVPTLFVGGDFLQAGGASANRVAEWSGGVWSSLGSGMNGPVNALTMFDDQTGTGASLIAGGQFSTAGDVPAKRLARWNGTTWQELGGGVTGGSSPKVTALLSLNEATGPALYVGGDFMTAGTVSAARIARWKEGTWTPLGSGVNGGVLALEAFDDGSGPSVFVGGSFTTAGGNAVSRIAKWSQSGWTALGSGVGGSFPTVTSLRAWIEPTSGEPSLFAGGFFTQAGSAASNYVARWSGSDWYSLNKSVNGTIRAFTVMDDGSGNGTALYVGGEFTTAGGISANRIARWNGANWSALGSGLNGTVSSLAVFDDGTGQHLFAAGFFTSAGGSPANYVAKWDGASWTPVGAGTNSAVNQLLVLTEKNPYGPALIAAGFFTSAGGIPANRIARWDGRSWTTFGTGVDNIVSAVAWLDTSDGPASGLYIAGQFLNASGVPAARIAHWNGASWEPLGSGLNGSVSAIISFDDGTGSALYAGGIFTQAGGMPASRVAKWNGSEWSALGVGTSNAVFSLAVYQSSTSGAKQLVVGGGFLSAGGNLVNRLAAWDGTSWSGFGTGLSDFVATVEVFEWPTVGRPALFVGGAFLASPAGDSNLASWACPN